MTKNDIRSIYTQKVAELLALGYQIHPETMSGSQGEIAHIDLTNGSEILRVLIESRCSFSEAYGDILTILMNVLVTVSSIVVAVFMLLLLFDADVKKQMGM